MTPILPGAALALILAVCAQWLSHFVGVTLAGLPKSPISAIMVAILLGILVRNTFSLSSRWQAGIDFSLKRVMRLGIVLLGIRLGLADIGVIGAQSLLVIVPVVSVALLSVTWLSRRIGLSSRLGLLIAVGTSICGATAIVATAPAIGARNNEVSYAIGCITLFGVLAMLLYPFLAHFAFAAQSLPTGLFLGTAVHETAQVAGAGMAYEQFYQDPRVLEVATVTKLVRNLGMLVVIPLVTLLYHRQAGPSQQAPRPWQIVPLFIIGFAAMSLLRTAGDAGEMAFGFVARDDWIQFVHLLQRISEQLLTMAMAAVGLNTSVQELRGIGLTPLAVGFFSAALVGVVSAATILVAGF